MGVLLNVILPVFIVIGIGYVAAWRSWISAEHNAGILAFAQNFALPLLLFRAVSELDIDMMQALPIWAAFYPGALAGFAVGFAGAKYIFGRSAEDSVAIGFIGLFSNSLLLGLPITERAYGPDALTANIAIIALHSPFCYAVGITGMEIARNRGGSARQIGTKVLNALAHNGLIIGIVCGAVFNVFDIPLPVFVRDAFDMAGRAGLPAALFGLGGVLLRYRPEGDVKTVAFIVAVSLIVPPIIALGLALLYGLDIAAVRSVTVTAAMAPGVNAFLFANMYDRAKRVAATSVLIGTALTVLTAWGWLGVLGWLDHAV